MAGKEMFAIVLALATISVHGASHTATMCDAGTKPVTTTVACSTNSASCAKGTCCMDDTTKCGGITVPCDAGKYWDTLKVGIVAGTTDTSKKSNCCTSFGTCTGYSSCAAGYKLKANPGTLYCASSSCATSDASTCCELDTTKCGGVTALTCDNDKYWDTAKAGTAITTPITDTTKKSSCCSSRGTCAGYSSCAAGYKLKSSPGSIYCASMFCTTGEASTCCEVDTSKCGGMATEVAGSGFGSGFAVTAPAMYTCDASEYWDTAKAATTAGATHALTKTNCCTAKAHCDSYTCPSNYNPITNAATTDCGTNAASCTQNLCCTADTTKCAHTTVTCDTGFYKDSAKDGATAGSTTTAQKSACCTAVATCSFTSYSTGTPSPSPSPSPSPTPSPSPSGTGTTASGAMGLASFTAGGMAVVILANLIRPFVYF